MGSFERTIILSVDFWKAYEGGYVRVFLFIEMTKGCYKNFKNNDGQS